MTESYKVRVVKDYLVFCAGHFISYEGHRCEGLHGHNYRMTLEIEGPLDENRYVFDFSTLKKHGRALVNELDHRMLLATSNECFKLEESDGNVRVRTKGKDYSFPREDCVLLPIENTTAELIATYLGGRLLEILQREHNFRPTVLRVEIEESFGQSAFYEWRP
jgi:6-pyruvoyltetrahydropterin/6-carboxytetrahydropterin synthase